MSLGTVLGGAVGGIIGFFVSGMNPMGAIYGASIGAGIGYAIDPLTPDAPVPGNPDDGTEIMQSTIGDPIKDVLGTAKINGHLLTFGGERVVENYEEQSSGKGGGGADDTLTGYSYYMSWAVGICLGPIDTLYAVYRNDEVVWSGELNCPVSGGKETIVLSEGYDDPEIIDDCVPSEAYIEYTDPCAGLVGLDEYECQEQYAWYYTEDQDPCDGLVGLDLAECEDFWAWWYAQTTPWEGLIGMDKEDKKLQYPWVVEHAAVTCEPAETSGLIGSMDFYFGTADQALNTNLGLLLDDPTLNTPYRNLCWAFMDDNYIGDYNRAPTITFVIRKSPVLSFSTDQAIQTYEYNPAHAIWYILNTLSGLPVSWLNDAAFLVVADTLKTESRGICIAFKEQQSALTYLTEILAHIDGILRYDTDGTFYPLLIRDDYDVDTIPTINEDNLLEEPSITRNSWINTLNEVKVQYTELLNADRSIVTARTIIIEIDNGHGGTYLGPDSLGARSIEVYLNDDKLTLSGEAHASGSAGSQWTPSRAFNAAWSKTGIASGTSWRLITTVTNQYILWLSYADITFNKLVINNFHDSGGFVDVGIKDFRVYVSSESHATHINGVYPSDYKLVIDTIECAKHVGSDVEDPQEFTFIDV